LYLYCLNMRWMGPLWDLSRSQISFNSALWMPWKQRIFWQQIRITKTAATWICYRYFRVLKRLTSTICVRFWHITDLKCTFGCRYHGQGCEFDSRSHSIAELSLEWYLCQSIINLSNGGAIDSPCVYFGHSQHPVFFRRTAIYSSVSGRGEFEYSNWR